MQQRAHLFSYLPLHASAVSASRRLEQHSSRIRHGAEGEKTEKNISKCNSSCVSNLKTKKGRNKNHLYLFICFLKRCVWYCQGQRFKVEVQLDSCALNSFSKQQTGMFRFFSLSTSTFGCVSCQVRREEQSIFPCKCFFFFLMTEAPLCADRGYLLEAGQRHWRLLKVKKKADWHRMQHQLHRNNRIMSSSQHLTTHSSKSPHHSPHPCFNCHRWFSLFSLNSWLIAIIYIREHC